MKKLSITNYSLKVQLTLLVFISLLFLLGIVLFSLNTFVIEPVVLDNLTTNFNMGYEIIDNKYPGEWRLEGDRLYKGDVLMNDNYEIVDQIGELTGGSVTIFLNDTRVTTNITQNGDRILGTQVSDEVAKVVLEEQNEFYGTADIVGEEHLTAYKPIRNEQNEVIGIWYMGAPQDLTSNIIQTTSTIFIIAIIFISIIMTVSVKRIMIKPLDKAIKFATEIATGNLDLELMGAEREDEIGSLNLALNKMKNKLNNEISFMKNEISDIVSNLLSYSQQLAASAEEGNTTIETTNGLIQSMSAGIQQISASAEQVASFSEEANSQTDVGNQNIETTVDSIKEINKVVEETVEVINDLDTTSEEIEQIVELITNITEQTNLLALNAAIEAARASSTKGENGQGFAVVAEEIRQLATETAEATEKIANLVTKTQNQSKKGIEKIKEVEIKAKEGQKIAEKTGEVFNGIKISVQETASQIEQTASATNDLAQSSDQIITATEDIKNMSDEITSSSQELTVMAHKLQKLVEEFKV
ncbi:methyl-accepting chemotaxis protein [Natroniella sulfidigena]|uniref:methyl-accepting chemotaxis protein n=1 Tax=Natroniella sulfidigena TaxID=723921 RepID=UPI00200B0EA0|nr:methyl-accepting chemotaxis protein [Natroniella sulfidigena]MCK8818061.1 methyl-accepting chemotaxis protein [Natroniella sulfidigena]